ncbi:hypothetical protein AB0K00_17390 [Dactylosporangium sp. NPDC049525]|uniref:hypothetical protein n=1 Tax=Dactylosporangium sp. NPDC049525 TaxID=3154730 RepID=UPI0034403E75
MRRHLYGATAVFALALALTGCGGDDTAGTPKAGPTATASLDRQAKGVKFAQCMRENGIDVPDPEPGKPALMQFKNVDQAKVEKAMEACREWAPEGMTGGKQDPQQAEQMRKFAQCMRDNGVESFPDQEGNGIRIDAKVAEDPDFKAANEKCTKEFMPGLGK